MISKKFFYFAILSSLLLPVTVSAVEFSSISTRGNIGEGPDTKMVVGIELQGSGNRQIVFTGVGPSTGVDGFLENPKITLLNQNTKEPMLICDNWKSCFGANMVEVFLQNTGQSLDDAEAAISISLAAGRYVLEVYGAENSQAARAETDANASGVGLGAAFIANLGVDSNEVKSGTWNNDLETVCFHVTQLISDTRLTSTRDCENDASLNVVLAGKDDSGNDCVVSVNVEDDIVVENGEFTITQVGPGGSTEIVSGVFTHDNFAIGTATESNSGPNNLTQACVAEWDADNF